MKRNTRRAVSALLLVCLGCAGPQNVQDPVPFIFAVLDVGQGLAQIGKLGDTAVAWDMGDRTQYALWQAGYVSLGRPYLSAIVVSHGDMDHRGGLDMLAFETGFSGTVIVSPYEDTAGLRAASQHWADRLVFRTIRRGDTLAFLQGVRMECLWPADSAQLGHEFLSSASANRLSLCFRLTHGLATVLVTGDIDSVAMRCIADAECYGLESDAVVVPHHGSAGSLEALFYGYAVPGVVVFSCGLGNTYGHPAQEVVRFLTMHMGAESFDTRCDGTVAGESNGEYWVWR